MTQIPNQLVIRIPTIFRTPTLLTESLKPQSVPPQVFVFHILLQHLNTGCPSTKYLLFQTTFCRFSNGRCSHMTYHSKPGHVSPVFKWLSITDDLNNHTRYQCANRPFKNQTMATGHIQTIWQLALSGIRMVTVFVLYLINAIYDDAVLKSCD